MRYFTREFIGGLLGDVDRQRAFDAYMGYLAKLQLPQPLDDLARLNLHDARILFAERQERVGTLNVRFSHFDRQIGYAETFVRFHRVDMDSPALRCLVRGAKDLRVEVLSTELESVGSYLEFRMLLWPRGEVRWRFKNATIWTRPRWARRRLICS